MDDVMNMVIIFIIITHFLRRSTDIPIIIN